MARTINCFEDFRQRLQGDCEPFAYHVRELEQLYGDTYRRDAALIMQQLESFASHHGDALPGVLHRYEEYTRELLAEYEAYRRTRRYRHSSEEEIEHIVDGEQFKKEYLYTLTLSTALNRSRYEVHLHFKEMIKKYLKPGSTILEIGGGNCLNALLASDYGRVCVYEKNELSLLWHEILELQDKVELKIQTYRFDEPNRYDFVVMVELLEHVNDPSRYLDGAYTVLKDKGHAYLTFALRMPQVDHVSEFTSVEQCHALLDEAGLPVVEEYCTISSHRPFDEEERWELARDPKYPVTYCCVVGKFASNEASPQVESFNEELEAL